MNVFYTFEDTAICKREHNLSMVVPCCQEEFDTRIFRHVQDLVRNETYCCERQTDVIPFELPMVLGL